MGKCRKIRLVKNFFSFIFFLGIGLNLFAFPIVSGDISQGNIRFSEGNFATSIYEKLPLCDEVLVIGKDGTAVRIPANAFEMVNYSLKNGIWNLTSTKLPPVCNIRNIKEICIKQSPAKYSVLIKNDSYIREYSPFMFILNNFKFLGESEKNGYILKKYKLISDNNNLLQKNIDKIILTSGKSIKPEKPEIILKNYYFSCFQDTIKEIILKSREKR